MMPQCPPAELPEVIRLFCEGRGLPMPTWWGQSGEDVVEFVIPVRLKVIDRGLHLISSSFKIMEAEKKNGG